MFTTITRCKYSASLLLALFALVLSGGAYAQIDPEHGMGVTKTCGAPVRTCDSDADCADDNECTVNTCDTTNTRVTYNCTFTATNIDGFGDSLLITNAQDVIKAFGGDVLVPLADLTISGVAGNTTCTVGGSLPCVLGAAGGGLGAGQVQFRSNTYEPTMNDPDPLPDQATVTYFDQCDGIPSESCNDTDSSIQQAVSQQQLETGCTETPLNCNDGDLCTDDSCDPASGCINTPNYDCDDGDACTDDSCDPATGECINAPDRKSVV